jgi:uncharacterized membrane protein
MANERMQAMTDPTPVPGWPQTPVVWRIAMACEEAVQRFERVMHDLATTAPTTATETRAQIAKALLTMQDPEPFLQPDYVVAPVLDGPITLMRREGGR